MPTVRENLAGQFPRFHLYTVLFRWVDHVHSWANAFTNASVTRDLILLKDSFGTEQRNLWFHNRTGQASLSLFIRYLNSVQGVLSYVSRSLGMAAASDLYSQSSKRHRNAVQSSSTSTSILSSSTPQSAVFNSNIPAATFYA